MILILTPYSFNPLHPRLEYIEKYLTKNGYKVKKYNLRCENRVINKLNWLSLTFFQVPSFFKSFKYIWRYRRESKIIYIQDLQYLPISIMAKLFGKKVIYDTLDNNVELNFYHLSNRFRIFKRFTFFKRVLTFLEKKLSRYFCDRIIVNSKALVEYFKPNKTNLIYYTSPFENRFTIKTHREKAFLYLGSFSLDKGADSILDFIAEYNYKLYIYGDTSSKLLKKISNIDNIIYKERISSIDLLDELKRLFDNHSLIGFSLIKDVHYSYATQEANKDIDYLAMGIPLIGNHRVPTKEKIDKGCGVFIDDKKSINQLLKDDLYYQTLSKNSIDYYNRFYSQNIFEKKLLDVVKSV
jgi:glycosyltransferase involved in cell wall biosynthesis